MTEEDEILVQRIRPLMKRRKGCSEQKMFGGLCFMINGNMCVGPWKGSLIVRLAKKEHDETQSLPHVHPMDITGKPDGSTLVVSGVITRFVEGNAALRLLVGMGAGSSYFDADIQVTDGGTNTSVTSLHADKNSWGLGGGIAASQTVDTFMKEAAKKTAAEVAPRLK